MRGKMESAKYPLGGNFSRFTGPILNINAGWETRCGREHILD